MPHNVYLKCIPPAQQCCDKLFRCFCRLVKQEASEIIISVQTKWYAQCIGRLLGLINSFLYRHRNENIMIKCRKGISTALEHSVGPKTLKIGEPLDEIYAGEAFNAKSLSLLIRVHYIGEIREYLMLFPSKNDNALLRRNKQSQSEATLVCELHLFPDPHLLLSH